MTNYSTCAGEGSLVVRTGESPPTDELVELDLERRSDTLVFSVVPTFILLSSPEPVLHTHKIRLLQSN